MKINAATINKLNPCQDRLDNFAEHYGAKSFSAKQFLKLKKITHHDKLWVAFRMMPRNKVRFVAGKIAKTVLPIFEKRYPNDNRPRLAIETALQPKLNKGAADAATDAADAAGAAAYAAGAAAAAADAAADAAAAAAAAGAAAYAATDAADAADAAADAAGAAAYAADAKQPQQRLQLKIILDYWKD